MLDRTQEGENVQLPNTLKIVNYSSRFVTRTARTQGIGQRKEAGLLGPTKSRLPSNLAVLGLKLVRSGAHLSPAELGPLGSNLGPTGVQHGATWHVWMQVGLSIRNLVLCGGLWCQSWAQDRPNVGNMALHEPLIKAKKRKNVGNSGKRASFQGVALSPQNCPNLAPLDPKLRCLGPS